MITIENVSVKYKKTVLKDVNIKASNGECIGLLGLNGSGKSTLLSAIAGIKNPASGKITTEGKIGFVTQENALIDELTAYDNILMWTSMKKDAIMKALQGPELSILKVSDFINVKVRNMSGGMKKRLALASVIITAHLLSPLQKPTAEHVDNALKAMERAGVLELKDRDYSHLSGGEQQLVLIARAVSQNSDILLMDEPLAALDIPAKSDILKFIDAFKANGGIIFIASHEAEVFEHCDKVYHLKDGKLVETDKSRPVAEVINA